MKLQRFVGILAASSILFSGGCSPASKTPLTYTGTAFDTVVNVQIYDSDDESLIEGCKNMCETYEAKFSRTVETSEISQINAAGGAPVEVSDETVRLIQKGLYYGDLSHGVFDITIGSLSSLWDFSADNPAVPSEEDLSEAIRHINYKNVEINGNLVSLSDPSAKLDLGAIAKGYIADQLKKYLKSEGVDHALINLGGNVLALGNKPDNSEFNIGIQNPKDKTGEPITAVRLDDQSAVTSGNYQRSFTKDNRLYHHILDPKTGYPCENDLSSVTIITDSSLTADALSTTCYLLGPELGMKLIDQLDNVDAVFIDKENNITYSKNFKH